MQLPLQGLQCRSLILKKKSEQIVETRQMASYVGRMEPSWLPAPELKGEDLSGCVEQLWSAWGRLLRALHILLARGPISSCSSKENSTGASTQFHDISICQVSLLSEFGLYSMFRKSSLQLFSAYITSNQTISVIRSRSDALEDAVFDAEGSWLELGNLHRACLLQTWKRNRFSIHAKVPAHKLQMEHYRLPFCRNHWFIYLFLRSWG